MARSLMHLFAGVILLSLGIYITLKTAHSLSDLWRREAAVKAAPVEHSPKNPDDVTDAARLRVYGLLAPHDDDASTDGDHEAFAPKLGGPVSALDHVHPSPDGGSQHLLHSRVTVKSYRGFSFVVPAHAYRPRVAGTFKSQTGSLPPTKVDVMLLDPQAFGDLLHHEGGTASFATEGPDGQVDWTLSPTFQGSQQYYLVFRNSGTGIVTMDVDLTISLN